MAKKADSRLLFNKEQQVMTVNDSKTNNMSHIQGSLWITWTRTDDRISIKDFLSDVSGTECK